MESLLPSSPPVSSSNISSISRRRGHRKGQGATSSLPSSCSLNLIFISFVGIFVTITFIIFHHQSTTNGPFHPPPLFSTDQLLTNEGRFRKTKQDCIPSTNSGACVKLGPSGYDSSHRKLRIGVLSPPGSIGTAFYSLLISSLRHAFGPSIEQKISFVFSTHVPPYGYGGNHGYTKIIRLSTDLFTGSMDALMMGGSSSSSSSAKGTERDVTSLLRQIVRWHCRLSHVAAHTGLMTVDVVDLMLDADRTMKDVFHFVWLGIDGGLESKGEYELNLKMNEFKKAVAEAQARRRSLFSLVPLEQALADELDMTNDLKEWPCLSFWDVDGGLEDNTPSNTNAKLMIPDCEAEFTNCNIMKDQCEIHKIVDGTWQGYTCG